MATLTIDTYQDSWIWSDTPGTNYGSDTVLGCMWINSPFSEARILLKFDKNAIIFGTGGGTVTKVELYVYAKNFGSGSDSFKVKRCNDFSESTVTWATRPSTSTSVDTTFPSTTYAWQTVDITTIYNAESSGILPIDIEAYTDGGDVRCESREFGSGHTPYLLVAYTEPDNIYVNSSTGNDTYVGDSCTAGRPKATFGAAYVKVVAGGTIHICNDGADFSGENITFTKPYSTAQGAAGVTNCKLPRFN